MKLEPMPQNSLVIWTVYQCPSDYPNEFVVRPHVVGNGGKRYVGLNVLRGKTLEEVRAQIPYGLLRFPRDPSDDPPIVESWM